MFLELEFRFGAGRAVPAPVVLPQPKDRKGTLSGPAPIRDPIVEQDGKLTPAWQRYFLSLSSAVEESQASKTHWGTRSELMALPVTPYLDGTLFHVTDWGVTYQLRNRRWKYAGGSLTCAQTSLAGLGLGEDDAGLLVDVSDFRHTLKWSGTEFTFAPGDVPGGYVQGFLVDPGVPGWALCDGSSGVPLLKGDGSLQYRDLPDLEDGAYLKFGDFRLSGSLLDAIAPRFTGEEYRPEGMNSRPELTMNSYTPAGTNSAPTFTGSALGTHSHGVGTFGISSESAGTPSGSVSSIAASGTAAVQIGSGAASAAASDHTHPAPSFTGNTLSGHSHSLSGSSESVSAGTPAGSVSAPVFTGTAAVLTGQVAEPIFSGFPKPVGGTIGTESELRRIILRPWFRQ